MKALKSILAMVISVAVVWAFCLTVPVGNAYNPPPEGSHYMGPSLTGQFTFSPLSEENDSAIFDFLGRCGSTVINKTGVVTPNAVFSQITKENLEAFVFVFDTWVPEDCYPHLSGYGAVPDGLVIVKVTNFEDLGTTKTADVVMLWVVPQ